MIEKDLDEWISNLEGIKIQINEFCQKGSITDKDFVIHVLNNLPEEYEIILNGLKNRLMASGDIVLMINVICKKLNHWYKKLKSENKEKEKA